MAHRDVRLGRRALLKGVGAGAALGPAALLGRAHGQSAPRDPRFLVVVAGAGGASIIDSFLALRESEVGAAADTLNCFPDAEVQSFDGSPFRAVSLQDTSAVGAIPLPFSSDQPGFVRKWKDELMVVTQTGTSVNHQVAQKRSITGNEAFGGRTLQEAVAAHHGEGYPLPNVNMSGGGFIEPGIDPTVPSWARAEPVAEAALWPLSLHGSRGIEGAPSPDRVRRARALRDQHLDPESVFGRTFSRSERLELWRSQRAQQARIEDLDLISRLNVFPDLPPFIPLTRYGLDASPDGAKVREAFPRFLDDPFEAQAALAFLLIKNRVSVTVTISPSFSVLLDTRPPPSVVNPPLAFDFSHNAHRAGQAVMWGRILSVADRLASLLRSEELSDGVSFWDRTCIYFATEFGRTRRRPARAAEFGTSHDLNNGFALLSPLVNGGRVLGGVDPSTGSTFGFDPEDPVGTPRPGTHMNEAQIYAGILHALGVPTPGHDLPDMRAMRKRA